MTIKLNELYRANYDYLVGANRDFRTQIDFLDELFQKHQVKTILDCGCGTGTHAILLAKMGYQVTAFDYNINQIDLAKQKAQKEGVKINFLVTDMKDFNLGKFDAIISLFSVLTFACPNKNDLDRVMKSIKNNLNSKGIVFLETNTPKLFEAEKMKVQKHSDLNLDIARVRFYDKTEEENLVEVAYIYLIKENNKDLKKIVASATNRFFTKEEIESTLKKNNFQLIKLYGSFNKELKTYQEYQEDSFFISPYFKNNQES